MRKILSLFFCFVLLNFGSLTLFVNAANAGEGGSTGVDGTNYNDEAGTISGRSLSDTLCNVLKFVTGSVGKTIATFAIIFIGVTFLNGKCNWTVLVTFSVGLAAIFAAPTIINAFTNGADGSICGSSTSSNG